MSSTNLTIVWHDEHEILLDDRLMYSVLVLVYFGMHALCLNY